VPLSVHWFLPTAGDSRDVVGFGPTAGRRPAGVGERLDALAPTEHPVVRTHPESGRRSLFVNPQFTAYVVELSLRQGEALLDEVYRHMTAPELTVRHRWRPGDVAFWDNRATMHDATQDYGDAARVMHRVTLAGDRPR
jgi:taurine dioxygenase